VWHRLGIGRKTPGAPGEPGAPGAEIALTSTNHVNQVENDAVGPTHQLGKPGDQHKHAEMRQVHRDNQVHRVETEALELGELAQQVAQSRRLCGCGRPGRVRTDTGMCDWCTVKAANEVPA
jgi:hypothetical protein